MTDLSPRHDWTRDDIAKLYALPLDTLMAHALTVKQANWPDGKVQKSQLLSIKTGGCAEDCGYCSQSAHFDTGLDASKLMPLDEVVTAARRAKENGADRFCMGAAWRSLKDRDVPKVAAMIEAVKAEGLETCVTLGMLDDGQAEALKSAGLDYYNHNLDTSPEYYGKVVSTRTYDDRLETLGRARTAGLKLCCGGILGMGESREDRIGLIHELSKLTPHPESVPVNMLVPIEGTPLGHSPAISVIEMARAIAVCRVVFPQSWVRLSAGREGMTEEGQALCLLAGANSIFVGDRLLTTDNPEIDEDDALMGQMGLEAAGRAEMEAPARRTTLIGG
ncbi:MAG TPA: biotin synthase BioB [Hyphomonas sp.]|jgi:biotin synthase|uniref:biotin synthase n=1 Tax=hydrothermal vent metagenome TaxID=652676 RepID=A0A170PTW8_9ZZZZ|nr:MULTISPECIES: biotin synthase BioB [unclassified Hyphomonas]MAN91074.1 biotin synthase BioB [Hyphomonadaceae bacterium]MBO6581548.1 biotin synthase BioB [Hyphomonas sp.]HAQ76007.1 biotin synthase BioB [Hyphomonas sp.]HBL93486.1 biotin synthase BioB [Hyphomonas sp.]HCN92116.1 biotin synthase BioB [Hyphomonas sp.]|tara:strand:- start:14659 stop:15660 length:1002 start_codon:yes stop_codon:yes gene_type:complete